MVHKLSTREGCFSVILSAVHHELSHLTKMYIFSRKESDSRFPTRFPIFSGVASEMTLRFARDFEIIGIQSFYMPRLVLGYFGVCLQRASSYAHRSVPKIYGNGYFSYELSISYFICLIPCFADAQVV